ncbi:hypothetical protein [Mycolicibacter icosiumassiliensis]|uniref:hypothetical protein n=1 Tax=Mycolicibacter icosiumassiliensis TaxID=1792835 RepID=UPI000829A9BA|nr:hypothetical protein [Mycolicibacter icosiumassiliensis]
MTGDPVVLEARTDTTRACPHCGERFEMPTKRRGRRPVWCSAKCRRAASARRVAAAAAGAPVTVVEVPRAHRPDADADARLPIPSMTTLMHLLLSSDYQCRTLLETIEHRYTHDQIQDHQLRAVVERFAAAVNRHQTLTADPDYQQARTEIQRLRDQLRRDVERATHRDHELGQLRHTAAQVPALRARIAELEAAATHRATGTTASGHPAPPPAWPAAGASASAPAPATPGLSRQQRRAAQRATGKKR